MSARETFLSSENLKHNYNFLVQKVEQQTGINARKYPDLEKQFQAMAKIYVNKMESTGAAEHELANLATMNNKLIDHAANFFCDKLRNKRQSSQRVTPKPGYPETKPAGSYYNEEHGFTMLDNNDDVSGAFSSLVANRNNELQKNARAVFDMPPSISGRDVSLTDNTPLNKQLKNMMLERSDINQPLSTNITNTPGLLPFNIDDEISNLLIREPGTDLPLYQNIMDLQSSTPINDRVQELEKERQQTLILSNTQEQQSNKSDNTSGLFNKNDSNLTSRLIQKRGENSVILDRNNTDVHTLNQKTEIRDPKELYTLSQSGKQELLNQMTSGTIGTNQMINATPSISDNLLIEKILSLQRELQPKYVERTNYIIVNSIDRDWYNTDETRYNFRVNFRPHSTYEGAGIVDLYRNITSVELVNALIPQDCVNIPFDTRVYIDILSFPYLLLQIKEFSDVFRGTNSHNDRAFSVLVYDKQHDSSVLSVDYISGSSDSIVQTSPKNQFYREYRKTFYKYTPAYFEKKVFFNQPLASLPHMTINIATPAGENLYTDEDVLTISEVDVEVLSGATGLEYQETHSYPNDASSATREYIRIQTTQAFSNKMFRLGDLIRIQGFDCGSAGINSTNFNEFMNRESGHYILNTDQCNLAAGANQGYTSNIYIAPPGVLNATNTAVDTNSYYIDTVTNAPWVQTESKLINVNLQTHLLFKINTREGDISPLSMPMNV